MFNMKLVPAALIAFAVGFGGTPSHSAEPADPDEIIAGEPNGSARIYQVSPSEDRIEIQVTLHKSESVRVGLPFSEALVGNAEVADVIPLTDRSIYIVGKQIGVTRLALLDNNKQLLGVVDVEVTYDLDGLRSRFRGNPGLDGIVVQSVNGKILLTGTVPDAVAMQQALILAQQLSPDDVTNAMKVAAPQQVMLEVRFIEANRSASKALGVESSIFGGDVSSLTGVGSFSGDNIAGFTNDLAAGLVSNSVPFGSLVASIVAGNTNIDLFIKALEERGLARRLAEPNLVALSGDTASFLAGGEFPFPASAKDDEITVEFKKFGVGLAFTPTVLSQGQINLKIEPEVSDLDPTKFIKVADGVEIPSLVVRRASTTVELRDGQSFAIAGLLQSNHSRSQDQLPWLGDVPVLGALMRSAAWQKEETDLVIIITPRLVKPIAPGQKLASPLAKRIPTNEKEFFLTGQQEEDTQQPDVHLGHIIDWSPEESVEDEGWKGVIQ
ncbi:MAG: type II and III secretion system protein family protein [Hyphomicrobiales bacterium]|nr:type II and III secretion system protein family protein [Hyphomicrobiales bacterium]